jgi:hypothetical protein
VLVKALQRAVTLVVAVREVDGVSKIRRMGRRQCKSESRLVTLQAWQLLVAGWV